MAPKKPNETKDDDDAHSDEEKNPFDLSDDDWAKDVGDFDAGADDVDDWAREEEEEAAPQTPAIPAVFSEEPVAAAGQLQQVQPPAAEAEHLVQPAEVQKPAAPAEIAPASTPVPPPSPQQQQPAAAVTAGEEQQQQQQQEEEEEDDEDEEEEAEERAGGWGFGALGGLKMLGAIKSIATGACAAGRHATPVCWSKCNTAAPTLPFPLQRNATSPTHLTPCITKPCTCTPGAV